MKSGIKERLKGILNPGKNVFPTDPAHMYFPRSSVALLIIILIGLSFFYGYHTILFLRPQGIHQWRQCDGLSLTLNYYQDGNAFFEPAMHNLAEDGTGKTANDFPLLYFLVAQLWKLFGYHEFIYRLVNIIIMFTGLVFLMKTTEFLLKDSFWAIAIALVLFTSPTLVYYTNNFLTNTTAFGLVLAAWYFILSFFRKGNRAAWLISFMFFALAGLLKVSAMVSFVALMVLFLLHLVRPSIFVNVSGFRYRTRYMVGFAIVLILVAGWYVYAHFYNKQHNEGYFLIGILPLWATDTAHIERIFIALKDHFRHSYLHPVMSWTLIFMWGIVVLFSRHANRVLLLLTLLTTIGLFAFGLLFYQALEQHDYYMINQMILVPIILVTFFDLIKRMCPAVFRSIFVRLGWLALLGMGILFSRTHIQYRYSPDGWENENRTRYTYALETIEPYLESIGIEPDDTVICASDHSINISLYLMNRKGWTRFNLHDRASLVDSKIRDGARYLVTYENESASPDWLAPFKADKIGQYHNISIHRMALDRKKIMASPGQ
jgi:hypothetical protein